MRPELSIIIVNYNTFELTCQCIASIMAQTQQVRYEIILVDNCSKECSPEAFLERFSDIQLIAHPENSGFGIANNIGMEAAQGDYLLLLNSDTIVIDGALDKCVKHLRQQPESIKILGCQLLNRDRSFQHSFYLPVHDHSIRGVISKTLQNNIFLTKLKAILNKSDAPIALPTKVEALSGAFILLHRSIFEQTGGFDPDFFMYCEETEWFRNRIKGHTQTIYYADAQVIHLVKGSDALGLSYKQNILSYFLYWHKIRRLNYWLHALLYYFNLGCLCLAFPLANDRSKVRTHIRYSLQVLPQVLFDIPCHTPSFGSRPSPLKIKEYQ